MGADSAKVLLEGSNQQRYRELTLNSDKELSLPRVSSVPWIGASPGRDVYKKEYFHEGELRHVKFITKNDDPHAFLWQTNPEQLKQGVRWGIIKTHSITGKVISALGQYRIVAHERAAKGMVSNSQAVKLKLVDLFQDRFTALQDLESLVNKNNTHAEYEKALSDYIKKLINIEAQLDDYFSDVTLAGLDEQSITQIKADLEEDRIRADAYLQSLLKEKDLHPFNRSRGKSSVLEFVKQQMNNGLYELQGINQDMTYSRKRDFALTRGELNDFIEDARKEIEDYQSDSRNALRQTHHGIYRANNENLVSYDFSSDNLTPARERQVLLAISFIEGWDKLEDKKNKTPIISNGKQSEVLDAYVATRWQTHRNVTATIKSVGNYILNIFKGIFVSTYSWEEETWENEAFHLQAAAMRVHAKPIEPMWKKPVYFFKQVGHALIDIFYGIRDFGAKLVIRMPQEIVNDWAASQAMPLLDETLAKATNEIKEISREEQQLILEILKQCGDTSFLSEVSKPTSRLATVEYELSDIEQNDLFNAIIRGLSGFTNVFTHNIYAKDPVAGFVFSTTYMIGVGMIYMPAFSASIFGGTLVNAFNNMSYAMASSPLGAAIAGGSTLAEVSAVAWDGMVHGPSGVAVNTLYQFGEDPLTFGSYLVAAYALGYFLSNGIAGYQIPWLSKMLQEEFGTDPSTGYLLTGGKFAVIFYEALAAHAKTTYVPPDLMAPGHRPEDVSTDNRRTIERFKFVFWLSNHAKMLPKLDSKTKFSISRQLDYLFSKEESESLKKLLYPEVRSSIAFQIVSIPLTYIPAVLRFLISPILSFVAWIKNNPYPAEPMRRSGSLLFDKVRKDLTRLVVCGVNINYLFYTLIATVCKMMAYIASMTIGRVAGLFDVKTGHVMHKSFAFIHNFMRNIGEFLYPVRTIKSVNFAHPNDTMIKTESSYEKLLQQMCQQGPHNESAALIKEAQTDPYLSLFLVSDKKNELVQGEEIDGGLSQFYAS